MSLLKPYVYVTDGLKCYIQIILIKLKCRQYLKDVIHYVLVTCWYTLKRISNWPLYKIWYYAIYL